MAGAAIKAWDQIVLRGAVGTSGVGGKHVKGVAALTAAPKRAERRRSFAGRTGKAFAAGDFGNAHKYLSLFKTTPTIERDKSCQYVIPVIILSDNIWNHYRNADKANDGCNHHTASLAKFEPE